MTKAYERTLAAWVKDKREELSDETKRLISAANQDLYYGPGGGDNEDDGFVYPGFVTACKKIFEALDDVRDIWIDDNAEDWTDKEPDEIELYYQVDRKVLIRALVGVELANSL